MHRLDLDILSQPDDVTCGPTCLQAVYAYYQDPLEIERVIAEVERLENAGTLAVLLGCHALRRGYGATLHTANLVAFDPTWFGEDGEPEEVEDRDGEGATGDLAGRLRAQAEAKDDPRLRFATRAYLEFLELGGRIRFADLGPSLLWRLLEEGRPILTGLSATYLYGCAREVDVHGRLHYDDVRGEPMGHFVVLSGYERASEMVWVSDPLHENPAYGTHTYPVEMERLVAAILLGQITYDANLLVVEPPEGWGTTGGPDLDSGVDPDAPATGEAPSP